MKTLGMALCFGALVAGAAAAQTAPSSGPQPLTSIVLVHGAFVEGSGWLGVYKLLRAKGYEVLVTQHPTISVADDVAVTRRAIARASGDVVLVGHSYGGVVISEAGNDPKVKALVYVTAYAPDAGESIASINASLPPSASPRPTLPPVEGFLILDPLKFPTVFAPDVNPETSEFMAYSQVPWSLDALNGAVTQPAWRSKPSWYLVAADDLVIPPRLQRSMAVRAQSQMIESPGSHAVYISHPLNVASIIEKAAAAMGQAK